MIVTDPVARARRLIGVRFRPQGHDPAYGLDCVGLALSTYPALTRVVRRNYRLRGDHLGEVRTAIAAAFRKVRAADARPGDLLLFAVAPDQLHMAVKTERGFIHADARLRRVVETPGEPGWPLIGAYRRRARVA